MKHVLVVPQELDQKLQAAYADTTTHDKWLAIGVDTVDEMYERIKLRLNEKNEKLEIESVRIEDKSVIKEKINNSSRVSLFAGYFENQDGNIDALFFYVDPDAANANDFLASKIPPVIIGIYKNYQSRTRDLHINSKPIYIVSLCTSSRVTNASVKQQIICAETMGFYYTDIFNNRLYDILNNGPDDVVTKIHSLSQYNDLITQGGTNDSFKVNDTNRSLEVTCTNTLGRTNDTAYIYRWFLKVLPAVYLAADEQYRIDLSAISTITNGDVPLLRDYIRKFPNTI